MIRAATIRSFVTSFLFVFCGTILIGTLVAASCPGKVADAADRLPALSSIATPTNAKRALVIGQALRVGYRDVLATKVAADGTVTAAEIVTLKAFDAQDSIFTSAWAKANTFVALWAATGGSAPADFSSAYLQLERVALEWFNTNGPMPVIVEGGH